MTDSSDFDELFGGNGERRTSSFAKAVHKDAPQQPVASEPKESTVGSTHYKPYGFMPAGNYHDVCDIQWWMDGTPFAQGTVISYRFLVRLGYLGEEELQLFCTDVIIKIQGRHLRDLRWKLGRRMVTFISQYNPMIWPEPPPQGEPVVTRIELMRTDFAGGKKVS
jgi:hypothetical protein